MTDKPDIKLEACPFCGTQLEPCVALQHAGYFRHKNGVKCALQGILFRPEDGWNTRAAQGRPHPAAVEGEVANYKPLSSEQIDKLFENICENRGFTNPHRKAGAIFWMYEAVKALNEIGAIWIPPTSQIVKD
jgi:hypothetical protein